MMADPPGLIAAHALLNAGRAALVVLLWLSNLFFGNFSARADGERRGARSDRRAAFEKGLGETRLYAPSGRLGSSAFAVGMRRDMA